MKKPNQVGRTFAACLIIFVGIGTIGGSRAQQATTPPKEAANPSAKDILAQVRLAYASLSTYRDTGWTVHQYKGDSWTNLFTELLGTRTCYRVEVVTAAHPFSRTNRFWCDGLENCCQMGGPTVFRGSDLTVNLARVFDDTCIPAVYFLLQWGNVFTPFKLGPDTELLRKPDETLGDESCFVVARTTPANPATVWVGKRDFLIRRSQTNSRIETHEHISTNEQFQVTDYVPLSARGSR
jgi:hypothetical protein